MDDSVQILSSTEIAKCYLCKSYIYDSNFEVRLIVETFGSAMAEVIEIDDNLNFDSDMLDYGYDLILKIFSKEYLNVKLLEVSLIEEYMYSKLISLYSIVFIDDGFIGIEVTEAFNSIGSCYGLEISSAMSKPASLALEVGDIIVSINDIFLNDITVEDSIKILKSLNDRKLLVAKKLDTANEKLNASNDFSIYGTGNATDDIPQIDDYFTYDDEFNDDLLLWKSIRNNFLLNSYFKNETSVLYNHDFLIDDTQKYISNLKISSYLGDHRLISNATHKIKIHMYY